ncbi:MAG: acyl-CoA dehydrogenase family protein [Deferrisomatales bacterium]|nr:acyl-CoA dehydrogenase family protein [Deferrisomatales bacterium]
MSETAYVRGGSFLVRESQPDDIFTPEDFTSEQLQFAKTARDFIENDVLPVSDRLEAKEPGLSEALMRKAGELGLLMADVPEEYGGLGLDKASSALITENISGQGSFSVTYGAHVGIGTLPLVYYGSPEVKREFLPGLADGSRIGCYCLTEPTSGSDALSIRTKAVLSEDETHYVLNGTKMWITNGGSAQVFTVFAKVDGELFTGFVMGRDTPGLSVGPEEHKLGIVGSSTTTVVLEDTRVPVGNVLGEVGKGHKIAFNILNIGRFKLGAGCVGSCKRALAHALAYALERRQFGKRLAELGLIREKLARMAVRTYAAESAVYRTVGLIDHILRSGEAHGEAALQSIEEYSVECALVKLLGSEALDFVVDETLQIYGGYGYSSEYPAERYYRDSRINRIFEGTNEINRLLVPGMLLRKAMKGEIPLFAAAKALQEELLGIPSFDLDAEAGLLDPEKKIVANLKKIFLLVAGVAAQKYGKDLAEQQPVLARLADLALAAFTAESTLLRALKDAGRRGEEAAAFPVAAARITCEEAVSQAESLAREGLAAMEAGDTLNTMLAALRRLLRRTPADTVALREQIATRLVEMERLVY